MEQFTKEYIEENTFEGCGVQKGNFFILKPSEYVDRIPNAKDLDDAQRLAIMRYAKPKRYNHVYTIAFSVNTDNLNDEVTAAELIDGLQQRLNDMRESDDEMIAACGDAI